MADYSLIIKKGTKVGKATSASSVQSIDPVVQRMALEWKNNHDHISKLLEDLQSNTPAEVIDSAVSLVKEYADVFAVIYLYLGNFTKIEHHIDTGDARPVKQRMRRTPALYHGKEEGHLEKTLKAVVCGLPGNK